MTARGLVVEDDPLLLPTIKSTLRSIHHRCTWVTNGAFEELSEKAPRQWRMISR